MKVVFLVFLFVGICLVGFAYCWYVGIGRLSDFERALENYFAAIDCGSDKVPAQKIEEVVYNLYVAPMALLVDAANRGSPAAKALLGKAMEKERQRNKMKSAETDASEKNEAPAP